MKQAKPISSRKATTIAVGIVAGVVAASVILSIGGARVSARALAAPGIELSPELEAQFEAWKTGKDQAAVRSRVRKLYKLDTLGRADDLWVAAQILESGKCEEDQLMAHDMALAALALGKSQAVAIVTRTHDRFLSYHNLAPRYATKNEAVPPRLRQLLRADVQTMPIAPGKVETAVLTAE